MAYSVGESVSGVVCGVTDYGAFVRLEDGTNGMIHISKLSTDFISDIRSFIKKGDKVTATVISSADGRLALSLIGDKPNLDTPRFFRRNNENTDFETMISSFKSISEEKLAKIHSRDKKKRR